MDTSLFPAFSPYVGKVKLRYSQTSTDEHLHNRLLWGYQVMVQFQFLTALMNKNFLSCPEKWYDPSDGQTAQRLWQPHHAESILFLMQSKPSYWCRRGGQRLQAQEQFYKFVYSVFDWGLCMGSHRRLADDGVQMQGTQMYICGPGKITLLHANKPLCQSCVITARNDRIQPLETHSERRWRGWYEGRDYFRREWHFMLHGYAHLLTCMCLCECAYYCQTQRLLTSMMASWALTLLCFLWHESPPRVFLVACNFSLCFKLCFQSVCTDSFVFWFFFLQIHQPVTWLQTELCVRSSAGDHIALTDGTFCPRSPEELHLGTTHICKHTCTSKQAPTHAQPCSFNECIREQSW